MEILDLRSFNLFLLRKWWWKIISNNTSKLQKILRKIYSLSEGTGGAQSRNCTNISSFGKEIRQVEDIFWRDLAYKPAQGGDISFWLDRWCTNISFASIYLNRFQVLDNKFIAVNKLIRNGKWLFDENDAILAWLSH